MRRWKPFLLMLALSCVTGPLLWKYALAPLSYVQHKATFDRITARETRAEIVKLLGDHDYEVQDIHPEKRTTFLCWYRPWCHIVVEVNEQGRVWTASLQPYNWPWHYRRADAPRPWENGW